MVKHIFIIYLFVSAFLCGCVTIQPVAETKTMKACNAIISDQKSVFFGQGYGRSYEIAMHNAQAELANNISSAVKSKVLFEENMTGDILQTSFNSKFELTTDTIPIDGYELLDTCQQQNQYRVSLALNKVGYKTTLKQKLLKQITAIKQLIAKVKSEDEYYKAKTIKELRASYQELQQIQYLNGIYGESLSMVDSVSLNYTEYSAKNILNAENNNFVAVKYSNNSRFAEGAIESALNNAGIKVTNSQDKSYVYLELKTTDNSSKIGSLYMSKLQLQLNIKKSNNDDILYTRRIGSSIGNSQTSASFAKESAQRKLQGELNNFLVNKFSLLVKELKI